MHLVPAGKKSKQNYSPSTWMEGVRCTMRPEMEFCTMNHHCVGRPFVRSEAIWCHSEYKTDLLVKSSQSTLGIWKTESFRTLLDCLSHLVVTIFSVHSLPINAQFCKRKNNNCQPVGTVPCMFCVKQELQAMWYWFNSDIFQVQE